MEKKYTDKDFNMVVTGLLIVFISLVFISSYISYYQGRNTVYTEACKKHLGFWKFNDSGYSVFKWNR